MIRKFYKKKSDIETYSMKGYLEGPIFAYGKIGGGKSVSILSIVQGFHDNFKYKIFDIYGGERHEGLYWTVPSQEIDYINKLRLLGKFDESYAKQYKVNLLYPFFATKIPRKLPKKLPFVNSKAFTIPLKDISIDDVSCVIGMPSEISKYAWNELVYSASKKDNSGSLLGLSKKVKGIGNTPLYKNFILPMSREKFIMDSYCDYNLDFISEARNVETISVLCLDFVPKQFHTFVINYLCRKLNELIDLNKITKKNILFMREAANFFKATDDSILDDRLKIFRNNMANYIRMGRRGTYYAMDCQSPAETKGLVSGSEDFLLMFRMTSWRDKAEITEEMKREGRIRNDQIASLAFLEKGQCFIAETARNVRKVQILLPRSMFWKKEYGNFYTNVWEKYGGEWMSTEIIFDYINAKYKEMHDKYKDVKEKAIEEKKIEALKITDEEINIIQIRKPELTKSEIKILKQPIINRPKLVI